MHKKFTASTTALEHLKASKNTAVRNARGEGQTTECMNVKHDYTNPLVRTACASGLYPTPDSLGVDTPASLQLINSAVTANSKVLTCCA